MENIKQKIVLPTRGVCNTTPDPICEDNEMEDCVGLTYADDCMKITRKERRWNKTLISCFLIQRTNVNKIIKRKSGAHVVSVYSQHIC